jgi:hypothetical protein
MIYQIERYTKYAITLITLCYDLDIFYMFFYFFSIKIYQFYKN